MEWSVSSLAFKGSISEAILEAKKQRKLFVVYISGEDAESISLEKSTWTESTVADSLSKYCILLNIQAGSADAANFSAIYPQNSVPCITAIGYNGVQLWQNEGFVSAEVLASSLEKAWLSLQIQETTATVLTAALAAKKSEPSTSASNTSCNEEGNSSTTAVPSPSAEIHVHSSEPRAMDVSETTDKDDGFQCKVEEQSTELGDKTTSKSFDGKESKRVGEQSTSSPQAAKGSSNPVTEDFGNPGSDHISSSIENSCPAPENITGQSLGSLVGDPQLVGTDANITVRDEKIEATDHTRVVGTDANRTVQDEKTEAADHKKVDATDDIPRVDKSNDAFLNIRMPNGGSLQEKFSLTSNLGMVKDYVDKNQESNIGPYDLATPYPRKVFSDQDMSKSLSELGLLNRQALIVVPRQKGAGYHRGESSSINQTTPTANADSSNGSGAGYFAYLRRALSYANPLSYLGGSPSSSSSGEGTQDGMWQYRPNPALQNNLSRNPQPNQSSSTIGRNESKNKRPTTSQYGSNIHTLRREEDDDRFNDRNAFWNGNSTQYGGGNNNDGK